MSEGLRSTPRGLITELDAGRYRAVAREGVLVIEREDTSETVGALMVPIARELVAELVAVWSKPVQFKIEGGELVFRTVP